MKISDALAGMKRLAIDTAPFIYFVERHPIYLDRMRSVFKFIDTGTIAGFSSTVTLTEVLTQPFKTGNTTFEKEYRNILVNSNNFTLVPINISIAERAAQLRAQYNLKTPDALQVSSAVATGCDAFLTNDMGLKRVKEMRVLVLDELELDPTGN